MPYYWNIRPNVDFMAEPVYYAKRGVDFAGELRYLTPRQRGTLDFNYLPSDDVDRASTARACSSSTSPSCPATGASASTPRTSATADYFEDFAHGPEGTSVPFTERLAEAVVSR